MNSQRTLTRCRRRLVIVTGILGSLSRDWQSGKGKHAGDESTPIGQGGVLKLK